MSDIFDPYYKWLGIPPDEQPPHRYRLLGIKPFEADPDVIEAAADQRMLLLRTHQTGKYGRLSQKLLNEVAAAKISLLTPETRADYDAKLRGELETQAGPAVPPPPRIEHGVQSAPTPRVVDPSEADSSPSSPHGRSAWRVALVAAVVVFATVVVVSAATYYWPTIDGWLASRAPEDDTSPNGSSLPQSPDGESASGKWATLEIPWPEAERGLGELEINGSPVALPPTGPVEYQCEAGHYRILARRPGHQLLVTSVTVEKGERHFVELPWMPLKTLLVIHWPVEYRDGAMLVIDDEPRDLASGIASEYRIEPGEHAIVATLPGFEEFRETVTLEPGGRMTIRLTWDDASVLVPPDAPDAVLTCNWPETQRADALVQINGTPTAVPPAGPCTFPLPAGRTTIRIQRPGYEPFEATISLIAGGNTIVNVAMVASKLPVPSPDRHQQIAQELDEHYAVEAATTPEEKCSLAARIFREKDEHEGNPDVQYVMLCRSMELATEGGDAPLVLDVLEAICAKYDVDLLDAKLRTWQSLAEQAATPEQLENVAGHGLLLVGELAAADRREETRATAVASLRAARLAADSVKFRALALWILVLEGDLPETVVQEAASSGENVDSRSPVPEGDALNRAEKGVRDLFAEGRRAARTPEAKGQLAEVILNMVTSSPRGEADDFVMLSMARDLAAEAGDDETTWEVIARLDALYRVDAFAMKTAAVSELVAGARSAKQNHDLAVRVFELVEEAVARGDANAAKQLVERCLRLARKAESPPLLNFLVERRKDVLKAIVDDPEVEAARIALNQDPLDAEANRTVGRHSCLVRGDWQNAVALVALGADDPLKAQAVQDLAGAATPADQKRLGDGWWDLSENEEGPAKQYLQSRTVHWYRLALPQLASAAKAEVGKRIAAFESTYLPPTLEPFPARICASSSGTYSMYVNGVSLDAGNLTAKVFETTLRRGDVLTVRVTRSSNKDGFCCVIEFQTGVVFTTSPTWESYEPKAGAPYFMPENITRRLPVVPSDSSTSTSGRSSRGTGTATSVTTLPLPTQRVLEQCGIPAPTIWAANGATTCYLTFTIP